MKTRKRLFAFLIAICLFVTMSVPAFAASAQYNTTKAFLKVLDREDTRYSYMGIDDDGDEQVNLTINGKNADKIDVKVYFDDDLDAVSMYSWYVISFTRDDLAAVLLKVNELNTEYRFVKFVVDTSDYSVDAEIDCPLRDDDNAGEIAYDALYYLLAIVDKGYAELKEYAK